MLATVRYNRQHTFVSSCLQLPLRLPSPSLQRWRLHTPDPAAWRWRYELIGVATSMTEHQIDPEDEYRRRFKDRALQREIEEAAEQLERNTRSLTDVFTEYMERGDEVEVTIGSRRWMGFVVGVGADVVTLESKRAIVDVALRAVSVVRVKSLGSGGGRDSRSRHCASFIATLRELAGASAGAIVELGGEGLPTLAGELRAAGESHVEMTTTSGDQVIVSLAAIGFVSTTR